MFQNLGTGEEKKKKKKKEKQKKKNSGGNRMFIKCEMRHQRTGNICQNWAKRHERMHTGQRSFARYSVTESVSLPNQSIILFIGLAAVVAVCTHTQHSPFQI